MDKKDIIIRNMNWFNLMYYLVSAVSSVLIVVFMVVLIGKYKELKDKVDNFNNTQTSSNKACEFIHEVSLDQPDFLFSHKPSEDLLIDALEYYNVRHPDIVFAQAILETGHFTSEVCNKYNNLFGLYNSATNDYYRFNHWSESIAAYIRCIEYKHDLHEDYYTFLTSIGYAEDPEYIVKLKKLVKQYENKSRDTERSIRDIQGER